MLHTQWRSQRNSTGPALKLTHSRGGPGACSPGKFLILEVWNGHFLRFHGEILQREHHKIV